ncbi:MAG: hypothetical protein P0107_00615 [Nitrosomonas sp.]|nr:hypothetical protein [Nitrosomonas sp.]
MSCKEANGLFPLLAANLLVWRSVWFTLPAAQQWKKQQIIEHFSGDHPVPYHCDELFALCKSPVRYREVFTPLFTTTTDYVCRYNQA